MQRTLIATLGKISNWFLSAFAGVSAFIFTFLGFILLSGLDEQLVASILMGLFALMVVWIAAEKPNSQHARAVTALIDRLLAVRSGDLTSPAPTLLRREMPPLAAAVDGLFEQVRSNLDNVNAMAMYDPVTALPNRVHFRREADRILKARRGQDITALLFVDLDGFKEVNDHLGHAQGDQVLVMVANRLRVVVKAESDGIGSPPLLARLAGDEFTLLLPDVGGRDEAARIAERVLEALSEPFRSGDILVEMGASIGVALCPDHGADLTILMKAADIAMYHAKASGRSRVCLFDAQLGEAAEEKARTQAALRRALERDEFELAFQPQTCTRTGAVVGAEALIRWTSPSASAHAADGFITVAEASSLILDIGDWAIHAAGQALGRWRVAGQGQRIALNVSPRQLERKDFFPRLRQALAGSSSAPWPLELEFAESTAMLCNDAVVAELEELRAQGISIAIDHFGAGHSNLTRIRRMPVDRIKLDRSLVAEIDSNAGARDIVSAVVHLIHGLGCEAVADGVERQEQVDVLRAIGCDSIQGFPLGAPMTEGAFLRWLRAQEPAAQPSAPRRIRA